MFRFGRMALIVGIFVSPFAAAPAHAQATRTWVSGVGDDTNACSRTLPCKTFIGAIGKTATNGTINCLDPGGFAAVTITKAITIDCTGVIAGILVSGTNGIVIDAPGAVVHLRGLRIDGITTGLAGVLALDVQSLFIEDCVITQFNSASVGIGISFRPTSGLLFVRDTVIDNNGAGQTIGGGILIGQGSGGFSLVNVKITNNVTGIAVTGHAAGELRNSVVAASFADAILATNGSLLVDNSSIINNVGAGVHAGGGAVRIGNSVITGNGTGVTGPSITSYKDNKIDNNGVNGTPIPAVPGYSGTAQ
jgi:hypothetical protein